MEKASRVIDYYVLCNRLKNLIRKGWIVWGVKKERLESVAEHIYGVQMLAIAMYSEYEYDIDLFKVIMMLAIHELEEIVIGDLTRFEISKEEKMIEGHKAVTELLKNLLKGQEIKDLVFEFDAGLTKEAQFAYHCDKLECDLQCKLYDEEGLVEMDKQDNMSWSSMWLESDRFYYQDDANFMEVLDYAKENTLSLKKTMDSNS